VLQLCHELNLPRTPRGIIRWRKKTEVRIAVGWMIGPGYVCMQLSYQLSLNLVISFRSYDGVQTYEYDFTWGSSVSVAIRLQAARPEYNSRQG